MRSPICDLFDIEFPLLAFSHCRDVVVEVSRAGGMGVFGAVSLPPERLEEELRWIDDHIGGRPYGVDLIVPNKIAGKGQSLSTADLLALVPEEHKAYAAGILARYGIDAADLDDTRRGNLSLGRNLQEAGAAAALEVAFRHPIKLIANALGVPPPSMLDLGRKHGVPVAALVGTKQHAIRQVQAGVDILVVAGGEAGGHCGDVSTLVLVPEVWEAIQPYRNVPILAAGGIVTGRQMAACMAMGAAGAWTGSVWLTTNEAETNPIVKEKMIAASSRDTVRSRARTGKHSRQLRSPWTEAWESPEAPAPLPMPLQSFVSEPALRKIDKLAEGGHEGAKQLATYWVGQGVGLMNQRKSVRAVVQEFREDFLTAYERLSACLAD
ncbi:MAG: monooxygenase [Polyangiaceae bacterium UTPRO1]|jgi:NAD(P)H-dependent flavin oxidoreductase YrpB (nitropropane dioxygenase family)|nr:nitronate monooxygenase [Myxococcales bacterium]OQY67223.1 MAG: monooxygenase [Polyangiaceae bacterium UTPRO1]